MSQMAELSEKEGKESKNEDSKDMWSDDSVLEICTPSEFEESLFSSDEPIPASREEGLSHLDFSELELSPKSATTSDLDLDLHYLLPEVAMFDIKAKKRAESERVCPPTPKRLRTTKRNAILDQTRTLIAFCKEEPRCSTFEFEEDIGSGSFGRIWSVSHKTTGERFAIKESKVKLATIMERELLIQSLMNLKRLLSTSGEWHPHILKHYAVWQESKQLYVQTELCEGSDVIKYYSTKWSAGKLQESEIWKFIDQIAPTLDFMHERGVLHMDIKPENIYVTRDGVYKVGDFGMSVAQELWSKGEHEGDSMYLAPEVLRTNHLSPSADVFSFGMTLHRLITGECVHITDLLAGDKILSQTEFPVSSELRALIHAMINPKPEDRATLKHVVSTVKGIKRNQKKMMLLTHLHG